MYSFNTSVLSNHRPTCPHRQPPNKLYFAYGSNMSVAQMAQRCPGSVFKGPAILDSFRWHINERGVANVLKSDDNHSVEGLLYTVTPKDESTLDRNEGVSKGFYHKHLAMVSVQPHGQYTDFKTARLALLLKQRRQEIGDSSNDRTSRRSLWTKVPALVYVSEDYVRDGPIRDEYIPRMQNAVNDAVCLGVSKPFVNKSIAPFLQRPATLSIGNHQLEQKKVQEKGLETEHRDTVTIKGTSQENSVNGEASYDTKKTNRLEREVSQSEPAKTRRLQADRIDLLRYDDCLCVFPVEMLDAIDKAAKVCGPANTLSDYYVILERMTSVEKSLSIVANARNACQANKQIIKVFKDILKTEVKSSEVSSEDLDVTAVRQEYPAWGTAMVGSTG
ncbi:unnamed protein product [Fusarium graminearum]|nr:unnamed protein product [Fusarium graminearum]